VPSCTQIWQPHCEKGSQESCEEKGSQESHKEIKQKDMGELNVMADPVEMQIAVAKEASDNCAKQYDDYYKSFMGLDNKAQSAATVSGVVLAAFVAIVNSGHTKALLSSGCICSYLLLLAPAIGALVTVIVGLAASRVIEVTIPFAAIDQIGEAEALARIPIEEMSSSYVLSYHLERLTHWRIALADIDRSVLMKSRWVYAAQALLVLTLVFLLFLFVDLALMT